MAGYFVQNMKLIRNQTNPKGLNQPKMHHKLIETRMAQIGGVLLVLGFAMQLIAEIKK